jgi:integrase
MSIRRRCTEWTCKDGRKCLDHLRFDVMWRGKRYRMAVNEFAIPRMEPGKQRPIQSMEEARDWERLFIGEVKAGRDPSRLPKPSPTPAVRLDDVATFLDAYWERCVKPAGLRSLGSVRSQISVLKQHLGKLPLSALEDADELNRFKTDSDWAEDVEIATVHRVLERLRAAINWGLAQTPPLFSRSPFHRFGVRLNKKAEAVRDRRLSRDEEKRLLDAALGVMNTAPHQSVGEMLHDRIIGALELCCRRGEMLLIQNKRINWDTCQIGIPGATAKDKENRRIPFNPNGRLAAILERRAVLGPNAYVFGSIQGEYQPTIQTAWETLKLLANGITPKLGKGKEDLAWNAEQVREIDLRWHDLRHEGACRLLSDGVDIRIIQLMLGHASIQQTQRYLNVTDEELRRGLEVSWRNQGRPLRLASGH